MRVTRADNGKRRIWRGLALASALLALVLSIYSVRRHLSARGQLSARGAIVETLVGESPATGPQTHTPAQPSAVAGEPAQASAVAGEPARPAPPEKRLALDKSAPREGQVAGASGSQAGLRGLPFEITSQLTEEERNVLREHRPEELGQMIALAHNRYDSARAAELPAAERHFRMLVDLWLKLHPGEAPERSVELLKREEQYFRDVPAEWSRLFHLPIPEEERQRKLDEFKRDFFSHFPD